MKRTSLYTRQPIESVSRMPKYQLAHYSTYANNQFLWVQNNTVVWVHLGADMIARFVSALRDINFRDKTAMSSGAHLRVSLSPLADSKLFHCTRQNEKKKKRELELKQCFARTPRDKTRQVWSRERKYRRRYAGICLPSELLLSHAFRSLVLATTKTRAQRTRDLVRSMPQSRK